jgi:hypothetical protein
MGEDDWSDPYKKYVAPVKEPPEPIVPLTFQEWLEHEFELGNASSGVLKRLAELPGYRDKMERIYRLWRAKKNGKG